jgi:death-on-curing family protein
MSEIVIYNADKGIQIDIKLENDTVWLSQRQMSELFVKDIDTISLHLKNIFLEGELDEISTTEFYSVVQKEGERQVNRKIKFYNLDAIISVGYRVNSIQGTKFRQWATQCLKDHLVKGYSINQKRLKELDQVLKIIEQSTHEDTLKLSESKGLLNILSTYTKSFVLLNQFDSNRLDTSSLTDDITYEIKYEEAILAISELKRQQIERKEATELFGNQKDESFKGTLQNVIQSFDGYYLYPTIEEQAAHLLYFIIKNHSFSDGNKRIGAFMFIWFLEKNKHLLKKSGEVKINDNALTAIALLVAQSNPDDKELMTKLICNLIKN